MHETQSVQNDYGIVFRHGGIVFGSANNRKKENVSIIQRYISVQVTTLKIHHFFKREPVSKLRLK